MQRTSAMEAAAMVSRGVFPAALILCLGFSGCGTSCYSGFWNGDASGVAVANTSCPLNRATGTVVAQMSTAATPSTTLAALPSPPASPGEIQHIFVSLRGTDARPRMVAGDASSGWQELAPDWVAHPVQLDLLALNGDSHFSGSPASANFSAMVPADEYRQFRLRLVPLHPSPEDLIPESNACGNVGWNCIVLADRSVRALEFDGAAPEIQITLAHGADNCFRVLPDEVVHLSIEFDAAGSVIFPSNASSNAAVRLAPVFKVVSGTHMAAPSAGGA